MTTAEQFAQKVDELSFKFRQANELASSDLLPPPVREVHDQLVEAMEELSVAQEELQQQNEELAQARQALELQKQRYQDLFDFAPDAYLVTDGQGVIREANRAAGLLFNVPIRFLLGKPMVVYLDPEHQREFRIALNQLAGSHENQDWTLHLTPRDSQPLTAAATVAAVADRRGKVRHIRWVIRDIGPRIETEQQVRRANEELEHRVAERTAELEHASRAKDYFIATLSHELRTPLNPALVAVSALEAQVDLPDHVREVVQLIHRNIELEARLIDDLLDVTRMARGQIELRNEVVNVHELLDSALRTCHDDIVAAELTLNVQYDASPESRFVRGDPARLQQVFWNLIKNSVKYTPRGGTLTVRTEDAGGGDGDNGNGNGDGGPDDERRVRVIVQDSGRGIEPEFLPRIFEPFEQESRGERRPPGFSGLGLGLTLAKGLVEAHGGSIEVQSEGRDRGTRVIVTLPSAPPVPAAEASEKPEAPPEVQRSLRILLVDDHRDTLRVMSRLLQSQGHVVFTADSVSAALEASKNAVVDLIISDIGLPDGSGHDLMRRLRRDRGIPGIALSGFGMEEDVKKSTDAGFASHLTKPIGLQQLTSAIQQAVNPN